MKRRSLLLGFLTAPFAGYFKPAVAKPADNIQCSIDALNKGTYDSSKILSGRPLIVEDLQPTMQCQVYYYTPMFDSQNFEILCIT